jgi:hypothetical protein
MENAAVRTAISYSVREESTVKLYGVRSFWNINEVWNTILRNHVLSTVDQPTQISSQHWHWTNQCKMMTISAAPETNGSNHWRCATDVTRNAHVLLCRDGWWKGFIVVMVEALIWGVNSQNGLSVCNEFVKNDKRTGYHFTQYWCQGQGTTVLSTT